MPKTAKSDITFPDGTANKTSTLTTQTVTTAIPFELPPGLSLSATGIRLLYFVRRNHALPFAQWPAHLRVSAHICALRERGLIRRCYEPLRFCLTKDGFNTLAWLDKLYERANAAPPQD